MRRARGSNTRTPGQSRARDECASATGHRIPAGRFGTRRCGAGDEAQQPGLIQLRAVVAAEKPEHPANKSPNRSSQAAAVYGAPHTSDRRPASDTDALDRQSTSSCALRAAQKSAARINAVGEVKRERPLAGFHEPAGGAERAFHWQPAAASLQTISPAEPATTHPAAGFASRRLLLRPAHQLQLSLRQHWNRILFAQSPPQTDRAPPQHRAEYPIPAAALLPSQLNRGKEQQRNDSISSSPAFLSDPYSEQTVPIPVVSAKPSTQMANASIQDRPSLTLIARGQRCYSAALALGSLPLLQFSSARESREFSLPQFSQQDHSGIHPP